MTLTKYPVSVANKELTGSLSPLDSALTKNRGVGVLLLTRIPKKDFYRHCPEFVGEGAARPRDLSPFPIRESPLTGHQSLVW